MKISPENLKAGQFDYQLPPDQIAAFPLPNRADSRLLEYSSGQISEHRFSDLPQILPPTTTLCLNNTRVIAARLHFQKPSGGVIEIFCLEPSAMPVEQALMTQESVVWNCLIGGASKWKPGQVLAKLVTVSGQEIELRAKYVARDEDSFRIDFSWEGAVPFHTILEEAGEMPLPPYIKRKAEAADRNRYQTVFGKIEGSVAAPTAALHFTDEIFEQLKENGITSRYITLHVGAGTFKPVKSETIAGHHMHREPFSITAEVLDFLSAAPSIVAVGTTTIRTLESLYWLGVKSILEPGLSSLSLGQWEAYELEERAGEITVEQSMHALEAHLSNGLLHAETSLIIVPGYQFRMAEGLITNFHQPQSTLLLLVSAFIGEDWKNVYAYALANQFRFLSYGDSSLLWRQKN